MLLAAQTWQLREAARRSLNAGEFEQAHQLATAAQNLQFTSSGESLRLLSAWLTALPGHVSVRVPVHTDT
jgi:hypothetical protein